MYNFTKDPHDRGPKHGEDLVTRMRRGKAEAHDTSPNIWLNRAHREGDWTKDEEHYADTTPLESLLETTRRRDS